MGREIMTYEYDVNTDKDIIEYEANQDAIHNGDYRKKLMRKIEYHNTPVYNSYEEAMDAINKINDGDYHNIAVRFNRYKFRKPTKKIENLKERIEKARESIVDYKKENSIKNRKSKFIGCTKCESRINKDYFSDYRWNECPLCEEDLSSNTIKKTLENRYNRVNEMELELKKEVDKNNKKGKPTEKWLVKTEYHV